ncbi:DUF4349 domain-containing protein [Metabacillus sp. RGM 3146]|uniref:DUF4349 domain-containing protein n=1 Tax=Metabacillus sp. RGM 3146 TaxID=3401092 RepID=UPI003B9D3AE7
MKKILAILILCSFFLNTGCSSGEKQSSSEKGSASSASVAKRSLNTGVEGVQDKSGPNPQKESKSPQTSGEKRLLVYTADMKLRVKDYQKAQQKIQQDTEDAGGYIVQSETKTPEGKGPMSGTLTARVPQQNFDNFLSAVENGSIKVLQKNVRGQDVTEEYVDIESRLKAKKAVEDRLLQFMKKASKTEDLLKISEDLGNVQAEIEQMMGRKTFLENQSAYSTVTIAFSETKINVPSIQEDELNTWQKTQKQFISSINVIINFFSAVFIFLIGNLPIWIILGFLAVIAYYIYRRKRKKDENPPASPDI